MRFVLAALALLPQIAFSQDAESLRAGIEEHYTAIHSGDEAWRSHHLREMSIFPGNGHALMEAGWEETAARMGRTQLRPRERQVTMTHFSAQLYGDVGIAMFYLDGEVDGESGTWRVTAVWVWEDGEWKEAHHHESRLIS
jgi:ketosteroid isomerase-like protein